MEEFLINFMKALLCWFLLSNVLGTVKGKFSRPAAGCIILALSVTLIEASLLHPVIRLAWVTGMHVLYSYCCFCGNRTARIAWGCIYMLSVLISERAVFRGFDVICQGSLNQILGPGPDRGLFVLIYLLFNLLVIWGVICLRRNRMVLPLKARVMVLTITLGALFLLDQFANMAVAINELEAYDDISIMADIVCILLLLIEISMVCIIIWFARVCEEKNILLTEQQKTESREMEYETARSAAEAMQVWRHNIKTHAQVAVGLIDSGHFQKAKEYIIQHADTMDVPSVIALSGNIVLDILLAGKYMQAIRLGIRVRYIIQRCECMPLDDISISVLFGNILENAIEACSHVKDRSERYIGLEIHVKNNYLHIRAENSCDGIYKGYGANLDSRKKEPGHGIGLKEIIRIAERQDGIYSVTPGKNLFRLIIAIPIKDER